MGVPEVLEAIVERIPAPKGEPEAPTRALIFDSEFDQYRGVIAYVRMVDGSFRKHERILAMQNGTEADIDDIGFFRPAMTAVRRDGGRRRRLPDHRDQGRRQAAGRRHADRPGAAPPPSPWRATARCGRWSSAALFPIDTDRYEDLRDALEKLALNDAALSWEPETSEALGFGFRCGFLGLLHMEIVRERLEREYDLDLLSTTPNVRYEVHTDQRRARWRSAAPPTCPTRATIESIEEPYIRATIICPSEQVGAVMELCQARRGTHVDMHYLSPLRVQIRYDMPLAEIVLDFFDLLKSSTRGYASLDYEPIGNRPSDLVKVDILLAGDKVDALSIIVHRDFAYEQGKRLVERLRKTIPRQQFDVPVQAAIGSNILARETVKAVRKDVTAKLYGGDVTRKKKLLKKQKAGKKRMKSVGRVEVPQEAFLAVLQIDE